MLRAYEMIDLESGRLCLTRFAWQESITKDNQLGSSADDNMRTGSRASCFAVVMLEDVGSLGRGQSLVGDFIMKRQTLLLWIFIDSNADLPSCETTSILAVCIIPDYGGASV
ncbi:unnamed protein product [Calypogeia fissa]